MSPFFVTKPDGSAIFGRPRPAVGMRVRFDRELLEATPREDWPTGQLATGPQGLVVWDLAMDTDVWPCHVWRVSDLEDPVRPFPRTPYVRCQSFLVEAQEPSWSVFGRHGEAVQALVERAGRITADEAAALARASNPGPDHEIHREVFRRWRRDRDGGALPKEERAPGGFAIGAAREAIERCALKADPATFDWLPRGIDRKELADPTWLSARDAAMATALATSVPEFLLPGEFELLTHRWISTIGDQ
jgi:hypothetical protein